MKLDDFNYHLPERLIATHPAPQRDAARLMVVPRHGGLLLHRSFRQLPELLRTGDCLVLNESRVLPARLILRRLHEEGPGGRTEVLLLTPIGRKSDCVWEAMVRPARKCPPGTHLVLPGGAGEALVLGGAGRVRRIRFMLTVSWEMFLERHGQTPLPPYILRERKVRGEAPEPTAQDRERYQTVYAQKNPPERSADPSSAADPGGSIAAPTAGLHFTPELLAVLAARGVEIRRVTLHVGAGTFEPIEAADITTHAMHREYYSIEPEEAQAIDAARLDPARRIVAVGTTAVRVLETSMARSGAILPVAGEAHESTNLFIYPGFDFRAVGALVTNFHLPGSTLLLLVAAFAGRERILEAYREAVAQEYRFYSYGDAMLIE